MRNNLLVLAFALLAGRGISQNADSLLTVKVVDSLLTTANDLRMAGKNEEALPLAQQATDISKQKWGENNTKYAASLHRLASIYQGLQQFDRATELYLKAIDLREKLLGKDDSNYAASLYGLALIYDIIGDYTKAEPLCIEAKDIWAKTLGKEDQSYARALNLLAIIYSKQGDYTKAEPLFWEAKVMREKTLSKENSDYAAFLNNLANLYYAKGDYAKAESFFLEAKGIWERTLGKEHPYYTAALGNLALLYADEGDYNKAERLYLEAIEILGKEHPEYATPLMNLANLYRFKGDYAKAESMFLEVMEILAKAFGKEDPKYATVLHNLGGLYIEKGDYSKAEPLFLEVIRIQTKSLGKERADYALHNLATLYYYKGDYTNAELLFGEVIEVRAKTLGKEHPLYATSLSNLANVYDAIGDNIKAERQYLEAKEIIVKALGKEHPDYTLLLSCLADHYQETNHILESATIFLEMNELDRRLIEKSAAYSSESQMLAYLYTFDKKTDQFRSIVQVCSSPDLSRASFDNALLLNGFLLENARHLARSVAESDSLTRDTYERWQGCRRRLANEYAMPIAERRYIAEVEAEAEGYEKTLIRNLPTITTQHAPHWQEVQIALKPSEAAVEFIHYRYYTPKATDSTMYAALVLRPGDTQPQFVPLFEEKELAPLLRGAAGGSNFVKINALYASKIAGSKQKSLYELIWKPLEGLLAGSKTVYCAPSGLLHRINLAAIATDDGRVYGERRQLVVLGSTRQLAIPNAGKQTSSNDAYLAGGIRYDSDSTAIAAANRASSSRGPEETDAPRFQPDSLNITRGEVLDYLPATAAEVREIGQILSASGIGAKVDTGFYATEEAFRQLGVGSPSPRIVHLATHGYFFPDPVSKMQKPGGILGQEPVFKMSEHPMIRSGLIMAGAKQAWLTGKHPAGLEDGILTAYEISQMDLSGTELVVLSACETGLGDIVGNEGVYGLQRAFKIAGAKYLIMSLWKVDDQSTRDFMTVFYRHWLTEKQSVPQAFRSTQREMRAKRPGAYDWAGFVLIE